MQVLITVDTEVYPLSPLWRQDHLRADLDRDIYGITAEGEFGLRYQLAFLRKTGLRATYFVESLFASCPSVAGGALEEMVGAIQNAGQEVQLHLHPEWIPFIPKLAHLQKPGCWLMTQFSETEQLELLENGLENLYRAGARKISAFRGGDYAANEWTLRALERVGIGIDSSHNHAYRASTSALAVGDAPCWLSARRGKILEVPIACYFDLPWHVRHAQVCAVTRREMQHALSCAHRAGWPSFAILLHSFELLRNRRSPTKRVKADGMVLNRFEALGAYLAANKDRYTVVPISEVSRNVLPAQPDPIQGRISNTVLRYGEQAARRISNWVRGENPVYSEVDKLVSLPMATGDRSVRDLVK